MRKVSQVWLLVVFVIAVLTAGCGVDAPATSPTTAAGARHARQRLN
jgi:hypothetical protein